MLNTRHDAPHDDQEWRTFLSRQDFGQLITSGRAGDLPMVVPVHYWYDGATTIELHLHRDNPLWSGLRENDRAVFAVLDAHVYIPTQWNGNPGEAIERAVPTSYYAAVQAIGKVTVLDDPAEIAAVLRRQMARMQPEGGYPPIEAGPTPVGRMLHAIRALRLAITDIRAKFKFGGNKSYEHQGAIAASLASRGTRGDRSAREHLLRRREQG